MESDWVQILIKIFFVFLLVLLNGFFVAAEFALVKVRGTRIDFLAQEGNRRAKFALKATSNLDAFLSATQLGITLASLGLGWIGEDTIASILTPILSNLGMSTMAIHSIAMIIAFILITILHIVLGELAPKSLAIHKAEAVTLWTVIPMTLFHKVMYPFIWLLNGTANGLLRLFSIHPANEHESAHTEEEIRILMKQSYKSGLIDNTELAFVDNIFDFTETHAREIMIPRTEMVCLYTGLSFAENKKIAIKEMHTRYPICHPDKDNIIGFVHIKDILMADEDLTDIRKIMRPITNVPDSMSISTLLKMMQKERTQLALLIDEYGGTSGLVTVEDIIEEIVGDIRDEFDEEERSEIEELADGSYSIDGRLLIEEVNDEFNLDIESEDYDTIGGWVYSQVEIPPKKNHRVTYDDYEFIIAETDHMRINRLTVRKLNLIDEKLTDKNLTH